VKTGRSSYAACEGVISKQHFGEPLRSQISFTGAPTISSTIDSAS
jgi:hypothetical protein